MLALAVGLAVIAWRTLPDVGAPPRAHSLRGAEALMFEPTGNSPPIVFGALLWLLWRRWPRLRAALGCPPRLELALPLFGIAAALCLWSHYVAAPALMLPALTAAMLAAGFWVGGTAGARVLLLPAVFVLVAFPIPAALLNQFMYPLQLFTARTVTNILNAFGLATTVHGDLIFREGAIFQVIESCSGVRTIETIVMTAFLYHDLFYRSRLQSWLLFLLAPFVGLAANLLRVIGIVLNPYSKFAAIHTLQGLVMIVIAVMMLAAVDVLLTRLLPAEAPGQRRRLRSVSALGLARAASLAAAFGLLAAASIWVRPWSEPPVQEIPLGSFPAELEGAPAEPLKLDSEFYGTTSFSEWMNRRYEKDGQWVEVLLVSDRRVDPFVSPVSPKIGVPIAGSVVEARQPLTLEGGIPAERLIVHSRRGRELVYVWSTGIDSPRVEILRALLSLDRSPYRRPGRAMVVRLATPADTNAEARLARFVSATQRALNETFPGEFPAP